MQSKQVVFLAAALIAAAPAARAAAVKVTSVRPDCPWPVAPSDPKSSDRTLATCFSRPSSRSRSAKSAAARMGPTVCELDGPMPIEKRSKTLSAMVS